MLNNSCFHNYNVYNFVVLQGIKVLTAQGIIIQCTMFRVINNVQNIINNIFDLNNTTMYEQCCQKFRSKIAIILLKKLIKLIKKIA